MKKPTTKRNKKVVAVPKNCPFCETKTEPDFLDTKTLGKYVTDRGKILSRARTGLCAKHQHRVTTAIKHARHLALMPFMAQV